MAEKWWRWTACICPHCGYQTDATTNVGEDRPMDAEPRAGDLSICLRCFRGAIFTGSGGLRLPTSEESVILAPHVARVEMARRRLGMR